MWFLLGTTLTASFFDSLNPSAIAQQLLLQAMVKTKRHIWFFIAGIGTVNLMMGLAIYYGIAAWASRLLTKGLEAWPLQIYGATLGLGLFSLVFGIRLLVKTKSGNAGSDGGEGGDEDGESSTVKAPIRLSPLSLFLTGAAFCGVELTSALPYFGFLALLTSYRLIFLLVLVFLLIYNFMYLLPLILLYFGYNRFQGTPVIKKAEQVLGKVSSYILPAAISLLGIFFVWYGLSSLL